MPTRGSTPEKGINAIWVAARAIATLELGRVDAETTCNLGVIHGGDATNIVPKQVEVGMGKCVAMTRANWKP